MQGKESASSLGTLFGLEPGTFTEALFHLGYASLLGPGPHPPGLGVSEAQE